MMCNVQKVGLRHSNIYRLSDVLRIRLRVDQLLGDAISAGSLQVLDISSWPGDIIGRRFFNEDYLRCNNGSLTVSGLTVDARFLAVDSADHGRGRMNPGLCSKNCVYLQIG
jgi:hypothetical protein